jgi:hypothetical protein
MKPKQKRIVAVLVTANVVVILGLVLWISHSLTKNPSPLPTSTSRSEELAGAFESPPVPSVRDIPTPGSPALAGPPSLPTASSYGACQWKAAQLLARAGLDGTVALTSDGTLRFDITSSLTPGQAVDEAAQSIWIAFDIALALVEEGCDFFTQVEVVVLAQGSQTSAHISASVSAADLIAFDAGELSEDQFAARVTYHVGDE